MKTRLDALLVERGLAATRERARALILAGQVRVDAGVKARRRSRPARWCRTTPRSRSPCPIIRTSAAAGSSWRTRSTSFAIDPRGRVALDVGASTGGFTDVLLQRGATRVVALDVGHGQLDWSLRTDPRVVVIERRQRAHADRRISSDPDAPRVFDLVTIDVSFISLRLMLPALVPLLAPDGRRGRAGEAAVRGRPRGRRRGRHRARPGRARAGRRRGGAPRRRAWACAPSAPTPSPIEGVEGNREFLAAFDPLHGDAPDRIS